MGIPWYYLLLYISVGALLIVIFDRYRIIKSKPMRYFTVILVYTLVCWLIYDLIFAPS